jgi:hypothetical protein
MRIDKLPMADPGREKDARELFPLAMPPEEYAARHGHEWLCFSFDDYCYSDAALDRWVQQLGDILFQRDGAPEIENLRKRYLTAEEQRTIEERSREMAEDF